MDGIVAAAERAAVCRGCTRADMHDQWCMFAGHRDQQILCRGDIRPG